MLKLQVVSYSKSRTVNDVIARITGYPKQECNTPEAFNGQTAEFSLYGTGRPVASLSEYYDVMKETKGSIKCTDGTVHVKRDAEGNWSAWQ